MRTIEPERIRSGDTIRWRREDLLSYPASLWTLTYILLMTGRQIVITASADGNNFVVNVPAATSASYIAGTYSWTAAVSNGAERYTVSTGKMEVLPNPATQTAGLDTRSHAKKVLDALEALLEGKATRDAQSITIAGQSITKMNPEELLRWRNFYRVEYNAELFKAGIQTQNKLKVRL